MVDQPRAVARFLNADGVPPPGGHYSHIVACSGWIFLSGHLPIPPNGVHDPAADIEVQVERVLDNIEASLATAGVSWVNLLKVNVYLTSLDDWDDFNRLYAKRLGSHKPARCAIYTPSLHFGYRIEIDAIGSS